MAELKTREPRQKVVLDAQVRIGAHWNDVRILDISAHGLSLQASERPARGAYLDVLRGHQSIVGRVVWVRGDRFGICTPDVLPVEDIIRPPEPESLELQRAIARAVALDRRARVAVARQQASRTPSRRIEFGVFVLLGAAVAASAFMSVAQTLGPPFDQLAALAPIAERR